MRDNKKTHVVYAIQCAVNSKVYIGCTTNVDSRVRAHFSDLRHGKKDRRNPETGKRTASDWQLDFNDYGSSSFKVFVLETDVPFDRAGEREEFWIEFYQATNPAYGYNIQRAKGRTAIPIESGLPHRLCAVPKEAV